MKFKSKEPKSTSTTPIIIINDKGVQAENSNQSAHNSVPALKQNKDIPKKNLLFKRRPLSLPDPITTLNFDLQDDEVNDHYSVDKQKDFDNWRSNFSKVELASLLLTPREQERQEIIYELVLTEVSYVKDLQFVLNTFIIPLRKTQILTEQQMGDLFINWVSLLDLHTELLANLLLRQKQQSPVISEIVDVILDKIESFDIYYQFLLKQPKAIQHYSLLLNTNKKFFNFVHKNNSCKGLDLPSYLLKPMQRLVKYPLLLKNLGLSSSSATADYFNVNKLLAKLQIILDKVQINSFNLQHRKTLKYWAKELNFNNQDVNINNLLDSIWCYGYSKFKCLSSNPQQPSLANSAKKEEWQLNFLILFPNFMFQLPLNTKPSQPLKPNAILTSDDPNLKLIKVLDVKLVRNHKQTKDDTIEMHLIGDTKFTCLVKFESCSLNSTTQSKDITSTWIELLRSAVVTHTT